MDPAGTARSGLKMNEASPLASVLTLLWPMKALPSLPEGLEKNWTMKLLRSAPSGKLFRLNADDPIMPV